MPPGVRALDHTADVGIRVEAGSIEELFDRAARGMVALVQDDTAEAAEEHSAEAAPAPRTPTAGEAVVAAVGEVGAAAAAGVEARVALEAADVATLLVKWLRELLFLREARGLEYRAAGFDVLEPTRLDARVTGEPPAGSGELKAVTYHGLVVEENEGRWRAEVIFDV